MVPPPKSIAEEHKCWKCGREWKVILDGMQGIIPEVYLEAYQAHLESCVKKKEDMYKPPKKPQKKATPRSKKERKNEE